MEDSQIWAAGLALTLGGFGDEALAALFGHVRTSASESGSPRTLALGSFTGST